MQWLAVASSSGAMLDDPTDPILDRAWLLEELDAIEQGANLDQARLGQLLHHRSATSQPLDRPRTSVPGVGVEPTQPRGARGV
jgi:hypothetical protein